VCDFLAAAANIESLPDCLLFEHNVETTIFQRYAQQSSSVLKRAFFRVQAAKMEAYEKYICGTVKHVIAVSEIDANRLRRMFGVQNVTSVPTGVDIDYFQPREDIIPSSDIVFCGSMDWLPNVDAVEFFVDEILPLIRAKLPGVTFTIAGRSPDARVLKAIRGISGIALTGTVDDIRPYLWGSRISVVPIRIGGGTRLKIYECMAAGIPVVSTTVGAEGLRYTNGNNIMIADSPEVFAAASVQLLSNDSFRIVLARRARKFAMHNLSWGAVCRDFESILRANRAVPQKASIESAR
jgi:glycosyltransferase involved in cell wall biosynthesis